MSTAAVSILDIAPKEFWIIYAHRHGHLKPLWPHYQDLSGGSKDEVLDRAYLKAGRDRVFNRKYRGHGLVAVRTDDMVLIGEDGKVTKEA